MGIIDIVVMTYYHFHGISTQSSTTQFIIIIVINTQAMDTTCKHILFVSHKETYFTLYIRGLVENYAWRFPFIKKLSHQFFCNIASSSFHVHFINLLCYIARLLMNEEKIGIKKWDYAIVYEKFDWLIEYKHESVYIPFCDIWNLLKHFARLDWILLKFLS